MRRGKWVVGAAAVVGLAWLVSNFFNMGGLGTGEGTRIGLPVQTPVPATPETPTGPPPQDEPETSPVSAEGEERSIGEGGVVDVLIDDGESTPDAPKTKYSLRRGTGDDAEWVRAEIDTIAGFARQAPGDQTGVRVRVFRKPSALASSEERLREALRGVGLADNEVDFPEKFVE